MLAGLVRLHFWSDAARLGTSARRSLSRTSGKSDCGDDIIVAKIVVTPPARGRNVMDTL